MESSNAAAPAIECMQRQLLQTATIANEGVCELTAADCAGGNGKGQTATDGQW